MVGADHLRIVFRVSGVAFLMPVADLLAIRGANEDELTQHEYSSELSRMGTFVYRETDTPVYDLALLFQLTQECHCETGPLLIFAGSDCPWAVRVDHVVGVFDSGSFELQSLPAYLFDDDAYVPYRQVSLYAGQLLISVDSQQLDQVWRRGL